MEKKLFSNKTELIKDALREYVANHKHEIDVKTFDIIESRLLLEKERKLERVREEKILDWTEKIRT
ncbi:MAG: hypothetical protein ACTSRS_14170 [Candidatus Helarchaeota archaeon]